MSRNTFVTEQPVILDGYQAVMKPSKFGYSLAAIVDQAMIDKLGISPETIEDIISSVLSIKVQGIKPG